MSTREREAKCADVCVAARGGDTTEARREHYRCVTRTRATRVELMQKPTRAFVGLVIMLVVLIGQVVGLVRYAHRLPSDWIGIGLYAASMVLIGGVMLLLLVEYMRPTHQG